MGRPTEINYYQLYKAGDINIPHSTKGHRKLKTRKCELCGQEFQLKNEYEVRFYKRCKRCHGHYTAPAKTITIDASLKARDEKQKKAFRIEQQLRKLKEGYG